MTKPLLLLAFGGAGFCDALNFDDDNGTFLLFFMFESYWVGSATEVSMLIHVACHLSSSCLLHSGYEVREVDRAEEVQAAPR